MTKEAFLCHCFTYSSLHTFLQMSIQKKMNVNIRKCVMKKFAERFGVSGKKSGFLRTIQKKRCTEKKWLQKSV